MIGDTCMGDGPTTARDHVGIDTRNETNTMLAKLLKNQCPAAAFDAHSEQPVTGQIEYQHDANAERASLVWGEGADQYRVTFIELEVPRNSVLVEIGSTVSIHTRDVARDYWNRLSQSGYRMQIDSAVDTNR